LPIVYPLPLPLGISCQWHQRHHTTIQASRSHTSRHWTYSADTGVATSRITPITPTLHMPSGYPSLPVCQAHSFLPQTVHAAPGCLPTPHPTLGSLRLCSPILRHRSGWDHPHRNPCLPLLRGEHCPFLASDLLVLCLLCCPGLLAFGVP